MTAKAKAIQVLVAVSITAVAYTIYTSSSGKKQAPAQVKGVTTQKTEKDNAVKAAETTITYKTDVVPGYSNPDERYR